MQRVVLFFTSCEISLGFRDPRDSHDPRTSWTEFEVSNETSFWKTRSAYIDAKEDCSEPERQTQIKIPRLSLTDYFKVKFKRTFISSFKPKSYNKRYPFKIILIQALTVARTLVVLILVSIDTNFNKLLESSNYPHDCLPYRNE